MRGTPHHRDPLHVLPSPGHLGDEPRPQHGQSDTDMACTRGVCHGQRTPRRSTASEALRRSRLPRGGPNGSPWRTPRSRAVLVGIAGREVGDRLLEPILPAHVRSERHRISDRACAVPGSTAYLRVERERRAPWSRREPKSSCLAADASRGSGRRGGPSSSRGRCRLRPASFVGPARRARPDGGSGSSAGGLQGPTLSPPWPAGTTGRLGLDPAAAR